MSLDVEMWGDPQEARPLRSVSLGLELAPQPLWLPPSPLPYPRTESTKPAFAGAGVGATTLKIPARVCALGSPAGPWGLRLVWVCCGLGGYQSKGASSPGRWPWEKSSALLQKAWDSGKEAGLALESRAALPFREPSDQESLLSAEGQERASWGGASRGARGQRCHLR